MGTVVLLYSTILATYVMLVWAIEALRATREREDNSRPAYRVVRHRRRWVCPTGRHRVNMRDVRSQRNYISYWHSSPFYSASPLLTRRSYSMP